jgi:hypothetical protein
VTTDCRGGRFTPSAVTVAFQEVVGKCGTRWLTGAHLRWHSRINGNRLHPTWVSTTGGGMAHLPRGGAVVVFRPRHRPCTCGWMPKARSVPPSAKLASLIHPARHGSEPAALLQSGVMTVTGGRGMLSVDCRWRSGQAHQVDQRHDPRPAPRRDPTGNCGGCGVPFSTASPLLQLIDRAVTGDLFQLMNADLLGQRHCWWNETAGVAVGSIPHGTFAAASLLRKSEMKT